MVAILALAIAVLFVPSPGDTAFASGYTVPEPTVLQVADEDALELNAAEFEISRTCTSGRIPVSRTDTTTLLLLSGLVVGGASRWRASERWRPGGVSVNAERWAANPSRLM